MYRNNKDQVAKIICYGVGCALAYYVFMWLLPYIAVALALYAFGRLLIECNRNNRR